MFGCRCGQVKTNKFIPLVVHVDQADAIAAALRFHSHCDCDMIIAGGAEAHVVKDMLKEHGACFSAGLDASALRLLRLRLMLCVSVCRSSVRVGSVCTACLALQTCR